jgi:hypothetical protein
MKKVRKDSRMRKIMLEIAKECARDQGRYEVEIGTFEDGKKRIFERIEQLLGAKQVSEKEAKYVYENFGGWIVTNASFYDKISAKDIEFIGIYDNKVDIYLRYSFNNFTNKENLCCFTPSNKHGREKDCGKYCIEEIDSGRITSDEWSRDYYDTDKDEFKKLSKEEKRRLDHKWYLRWLYADQRIVKSCKYDGCPVKKADKRELRIIAGDRDL